MNNPYQEFLGYLEAEDKEKCLTWALGKLENGTLDIAGLYEGVLAPALQKFTCDCQRQEICIWREHVRSGIVRTVLESCYLYVERERKRKHHNKLDQRVVIFCPSEEYHEIGARMIADYFTLFGYDVVFVGANTPKDDIVKAIDYVRPDYIALSVTNFYNLVQAEKIIKELVEKRTSLDLKYKILVGGEAFVGNPDQCPKMGADCLLKGYEDIEKLAKGMICQEGTHA